MQAEANTHPARNETDLERCDRNLVELLQEVRVVQTGVQILFAFLLMAPLTPRFGDLSSLQHMQYFVTLALSGAAALLLIALVLALTLLAALVAALVRVLVAIVVTHVSVLEVIGRSADRRGPPAMAVPARDVRQARLRHHGRARSLQRRCSRFKFCARADAAMTYCSRAQFTAVDLAVRARGALSRAAGRGDRHQLFR